MTEPSAAVTATEAPEALDVPALQAEHLAATPTTYSNPLRDPSDRRLPRVPAPCALVKQVRSVLWLNIGLSAHSQKQWIRSSVAGYLRAIS